jgi:hypothetical protein
VPDQPPKRIRAKSLADYLEVMTKAVFQSGFSWEVVESKWDGFRRAFHGFDPERVARLGRKEIEALSNDPAIIRNTRKIVATSDNADTLLALDAEYGGFKRYLRAHGDFWETAADLKRNFKFLGDFGAYYFLYVVGEQVPPYDEWRKVQRGGRSGAKSGRRSRAPQNRPRVPQR